MINDGALGFEPNLINFITAPERGYGFVFKFHRPGKLQICAGAGLRMIQHFFLYPDLTFNILAPARGFGGNEFEHRHEVFL